MSLGVKTFTLLHISFFSEPFWVQRQMKWLGFSWQCVVKVFTEGGSIKDANRSSYSIYDSYFATLLLVYKNWWIFDFALSVVKSDASCYCYDYYTDIFFWYIFFFQCWSVKLSWLCCFLLWQTPEPLCIRCKPINDILCVPACKLSLYSPHSEGWSCLNIQNLTLSFWVCSNLLGFCCKWTLIYKENIYIYPLKCLSDALLPCHKLNRLYWFTPCQSVQVRTNATFSCILFI